MPDLFTVTANVATVGAFAIEAGSRQPFTARMSRHVALEITARDIDLMHKLLGEVKSWVKTDSDKRAYNELAKRSKQHVTKLHQVFKTVQAKRLNVFNFFKIWTMINELKDQVAHDKALTITTSRKIRADFLQDCAREMKGSLASLDLDAAGSFDPYEMPQASIHNPFADRFRMASMTESVVASLTPIPELHEGGGVAEGEAQPEVVEIELQETTSVVVGPSKPDPAPA